jgi:hypothetical protein
MTRGLRKRIVGMKGSDQFVAHLSRLISWQVSCRACRKKTMNSKATGDFHIHCDPIIMLLASLDLKITYNRRAPFHRCSQAGDQHIASGSADCSLKEECTRPVAMLSFVFWALKFSLCPVILLGLKIGRRLMIL